MNLFVYGSLQDAECYYQVTGVHRQEKRRALLEGYALGEPVDGFPAIYPDDEGKVEGEVLLEVTAGEFEQLDAYEGAGYRRVIVSVHGEGKWMEAYAYAGIC